MQKMNISFLVISDENEFVLALSLKTGMVLFMSSYDDVCPSIVNTGLTGTVTVRLIKHAYDFVLLFSGLFMFIFLRGLIYGRCGCNLKLP